MKLKYFIRGLGAGIGFATIVLGIAFETYKKDISRDQVIARARELGMVFENQEDQLDETLDRLDQKVEKTLAPTEQPTKKPTPKPTVNPTKKPQPKTTKVPVKSPKPKTKTVEIVTVEIASGMWSTKIANYLESIGMVKNAEEFDSFLTENGYATKVRAGTFEIQKGASYEEIAKTITRQ